LIDAVQLRLKVKNKTDADLTLYAAAKGFVMTARQICKNLAITLLTFTSHFVVNF